MEETNTLEIVSYLKSNGFHVEINHEYILFKKGRSIKFDLKKRTVFISRGLPWRGDKMYLFELFKSFELSTKEQYADASPFHDGYKEYIHTIRLHLISGHKISLFSFMDREPEGDRILTGLMDILRNLMK